jgi:NTP pyrophosphatase (non-canonical NTP hydrolase)
MIKKSKTIRIKMKDYFELEACIEQWAEDKGILHKATPIKQAMKTQEEVTELCNAILDNDKDEIKDAIGDIVVTLIIQVKMQGITIEECLNAAYNVISKRTGQMINGQFVKDK